MKTAISKYMKEKKVIGFINGISMHTQLCCGQWENTGCCTPWKGLWHNLCWWDINKWTKASRETVGPKSMWGQHIFISIQMSTYSKLLAASCRDCYWYHYCLALLLMTLAMDRRHNQQIFREKTKLNTDSWHTGAQGWCFGQRQA